MRGRTKSTGHPFFPVPKGRYLATFALRSSFGESASCENVSTTYGAKPVQGFWRSQERKDISRGSGRAWISKPEVHGAHVLLFLHLTRSVICSKNTLTCTNRVTPQVFFRFRRHCKSKTRDARAGVLRMSGRTRFLLFFYAYWRNRTHVRGRGKMKQIPALMTWHRVLFLFTCSTPGCVRNMRTQSTCTDA